jgi:hypothetical protein
MSAATIDRKLAPARAKMLPRGRSHTKPGSILKSKIAMRTWVIDVDIAKFFDTVGFDVELPFVVLMLVRPGIGGSSQSRV